MNLSLLGPFEYLLQFERLKKYLELSETFIGEQYTAMIPNLRFSDGTPGIHSIIAVSNSMIVESRVDLSGRSDFDISSRNSVRNCRVYTGVHTVTAPASQDFEFAKIELLHVSSSNGGIKTDLMYYGSRRDEWLQHFSREFQPATLLGA